jgi:hypothetical protein
MRAATTVPFWRYALIFLSSFVLGCGGDTPPLGLVTGTVTLDGKPVEGAAIQFEPVSSGLPTAFGRTDAAGKYELWYSRGNKGASLGEAIVRIQAFQDANEDSGQKKRPEIIPAKYNAQSDLKVEVKRGAQTHNFDLKSGGLVIQPDAAEGGPAAKRAATGCG